MKKVALLFAAALFLAACHCERKTTGTPCRKASCQCMKNGTCPAKKARAAKKPARHAKKAAAVRHSTEQKAAAQAAELGALGAVNRRGNVISVSYKEPIRFAHNSDQIDSASNKELDSTAAILKKHQDSKVVVKGYTDSLGDPNYNIDLSQRRAQAVADALKARGVAAENVSAVGYGASNPVASNQTADGRRQNRRVELQIEVK